MTMTDGREATITGRRRLPIQIANEAKMIRATIELLERYEIDQITSRMIAETSETATNYISRYFGGRDGLLIATAEELGQRIADQIDGFRTRPGLDDAGAFLIEAVAIPEAQMWLKLYRHLAGRNLPSSAHPGTKPAIIAACEAAMIHIFRVEGEDVAFWANVFVTYMMGNMTFGSLLGTAEQESDRTLEKLAFVVETLRDRQIPIAP
jgi:AcrR family transcriptional regulator